MQVTVRYVLMCTDRDGAGLTDRARCRRHLMPVFRSVVRLVRARLVASRVRMPSIEPLRAASLRFLNLGSHQPNSLLCWRARCMSVLRKSVGISAEGRSKYNEHIDWLPASCADKGHSGHGGDSPRACIRVAICVRISVASARIMRVSGKTWIHLIG